MLSCPNLATFQQQNIISGTIAQTVHFHTSVTTTSEDLNSSPNSTVTLKVVKRAEVSIRSSIQPERIWYGGQLRGESAMKVMSDIGSKVSHTFQVTNDGPWHVEQAEVLIDWPYQLSVPGRDPNDNGKWLLYMSEPPEVSPKGMGTCFLNPRMVNHLGLRDPSSRGVGSYYTSGHQRIRRRLRRDSESESESASFSSSVPSSATRLHCLDERTKCQVINCRLWQLRANESAVIRIRSRIWNSTLVEEFIGHVAVAVEANARVVLRPDMAEHQDTSNDVTYVSLLGYPSPGQLGGAAAVPTWVILVAVALGLLVVGVIAVVLQKIGFFKRKRVEDGDDLDDDAVALHRDLMISAKVQQSSTATSAAASAAAAAAAASRRSRRLSKADEYIS
jgi:integrin alpha 7